MADGIATNLLKIPKGATRYGQGGHFVRPEEAEIILGDSKGTNQPVNKKIHPPPHPGSTMFVSPFPPLSIISTTTIYPPPYTAVEIGASPQDFQKSNVGAPMLSNEPFSSGRHRFGLDCGTSAHSTYSAVPSPLHHTGYSLVEPTSWYPHVQWDPSYWTSAIHYEHHPRLAPVLRSHPAKGDLAHVSPPTAPMPSGRWVFVPDYRQPQSAEGIEAQKTAGKLPRRDREDLARARRASAPLQDLISAKTTTSGNAKPVSPLTTPPSPKFHSQQSSEHHRSGDKRRSNGPEDGRVNRHVVPLVSRSRALVIQDEQSKCLSRDASRSYHQPQIERCVTTILTPPATPSSAGSLAQYNQPPLGDINDELRAIIDNLEKSTESETLGNTSPLTTDTISSPKALAALTEFAYDLINSIHPTTKTTITPVPMAAGSEGPSLEPIEGFPPSSAAVDSMVEMPMALNITLGVSVVEEEGGPGGAEAAIQRVHKDSTDITFNFEYDTNSCLPSLFILT